MKRRKKPFLFPSEREALEQLKRLLGNVIPHERKNDPYDFIWQQSRNRDIFIEAKPFDGSTGVHISLEQWMRLVALGDFRIWVPGNLLEPNQIIGVAHVHIHEFNDDYRTIRFCVRDGKVIGPRWCNGICAGYLL